MRIAVTHWSRVAPLSLALALSLAVPAAWCEDVAPAAPPAAVEVAAPEAAAPADPAADVKSEASTRALDEQIQDLKQSVVDLNKDLFVLEEELLFPANTQVAVFVSMDVGEFFGLDAVTLKVDNREVANYLYTPREVAALVKGGVQRLYGRPDQDIQADEVRIKIAQSYQRAARKTEAA